MGRLRKVTHIEPITTDDQIRHKESNAEISRKRVIVKNRRQGLGNSTGRNRKLRKRYANILIVTLILQTLAINVAFFLLGSDC